MSPLGRRSSGLRRERILSSPRFDGRSFVNVSGLGPGLRDGSTVPVMREFLFGGARRVPLAPLPSVDPRIAWQRSPETGLRATWLGHSTVLFEIDGARVLTDPVWGERASPVGFAGPKRFQPVPVAIEALPPIDAVIVSHDHYDHLCRDSVLALAQRGARFYTSLGVGAHLEAWGIPAERVHELDWWESAELPGLEISITAAPSQHFSGRSLADRNRTLWSSFVVRGERHAIFFSGDTGLTGEYTEIAARLGPFDLVLLEVGAFHPAWGHIHLGPDQALDALGLLGASRLLPVHWGTFNLAIHAWDEPAERLLELAATRPVELLMPRLGAAVEPSRYEPVDPWWRSVAALERRSGGPIESAPEALEPVGDPFD
jgi:L-ascorbate metabolism protein UlaG (beta-lactamase superfamily)